MFVYCEIKEIILVLLSNEISSFVYVRAKKKDT